MRGTEMEQDPLSHAPRPNKIVTELTTEEVDVDQKKSSAGKNAQKPAIYKAPKLSATVMEVN